VIERADPRFNLETTRSLLARPAARTLRNSPVTMRTLYILTAFAVVLTVSLSGSGTGLHAPADGRVPGVGLPGHEVPAEADPADAERVLL